MIEDRKMRKKFRHLTGAKENLAPYPGSRLCVHQAAAFVLDTPGAELVFGTFRAANDEEAARIPNASRVPFIHAWVEWQGIVISPVAEAACPREAYYKTNEATDIKRLTRPQLLKIAKEIGLSAHLRRGRPTKGNASVGAALLDAAGKRYRVGDNNQLLPVTP